MTVRQFSAAIPQPDQGLVIAAWGLEKVGKTYFSFTFPEPIFYFNFDYGWDAAIRAFPDKDIRVVDFFLGEHPDPVVWKRLMTDFEDTYKNAWEQVGTGTVVVDTATQLDQMVQNVTLADAAAAHSSGKNYRMDFQYRNRMMGGILRRPYLYPQANAVFLHRAKEAYDADGHATGKMVMHAFGETPAVVQATIQLSVEQGSGRYRFASCRMDRTLEGQSFPDPSYESLKVMLS